MRMRHAWRQTFGMLLFAAAAGGVGCGSGGGTGTVEEVAARANQLNGKLVRQERPT